MKRRISVAIVLALALVLAGCSSVRSQVLMDNRVNLSYAGAADGARLYTSDVGELSWREGEAITVNGKEFARVSGRSCDFVFDDGREMTGVMDGSGALREVRVAPGTEIEGDDYLVMEAALLVYQAESSIIRQRNGTMITVILVLAILAAAAIFAVRPVLDFAEKRGWLQFPDSQKVVTISRLAGIVLAAIALIFILVMVF